MQPGKTAPPFLPLDFASYNLSNRELPLANTQGHISEDAAKVSHSIFQAVLGTDQSEYAAKLGIRETDRTQPPYLAVSDYYLDFVRSGLINISTGRIEDRVGPTTRVSPGVADIQDVAAVVFATGYSAGPRLDFLPADVLETLGYSSTSPNLPLALCFHATHHPDVPALGFVGFYRSPYWGVMEMQARFLSYLWATEDLKESIPLTSIDETVSLRTDVRVSQFPMGDYPWLMQEFASALGMEISPPHSQQTLLLPHNNKPLDILTPPRYSSLHADEDAIVEWKGALDQTQGTALAGLESPKFEIGRASCRERV